MLLPPGKMDAYLGAQERDPSSPEGVLAIPELRHIWGPLHKGLSSGWQLRLVVLYGGPAGSVSSCSDLGKPAFWPPPAAAVTASVSSLLEVASDPFVGSCPVSMENQVVC